MLSMFLEGSRKMCFFQLSYRICWLCWLFLELTHHSRRSPENPTFNTYSCETRFFQKCACFCWNVEHVDCSWNVFEKMCFSLGKCRICWMFLELTDPFWMRPVSPKNIQHFQQMQHFPWKKHILGDRLSDICNRFNISAERSTFLEKNASLSCNVECWVPSKQLGCAKGVCKFQKHSTYSTYSSFPQKEALFLRKGFGHIQHIQHFRRKKHIFGKNASWSCNVECWVSSKQLGDSKGVCKSTSIQHIQHIQFPQKEVFSCLRKVFEPIWHIPHFCRKKHIFGEMLLSAVMLNVGSLPGSWGDQKGSVSSKNIHHIQHIQHFPRKMHFFEQSAFDCGTPKSGDTDRHRQKEKRKGQREKPR